MDLACRYSSILVDPTPETTRMIAEWIKTSTSGSVHTWVVDVCDTSLYHDEMHVYGFSLREDHVAFMLTWMDHPLP